jgi:hypothetical protein
MQNSNGWFGSGITIEAAMPLEHIVPDLFGSLKDLVKSKKQNDVSREYVE